MIKTEALLIFSQSIRCDLSPGQTILVPQWIGADSFIIETSINDRKISNDSKCGEIIQSFGVGFKETLGEKFSINFNTRKLIKVENFEPYRLKFTPVNWLKKQLQLKVHLMPLSQASPSYVISHNSTISQKTVTNTASKILNANVNRAGLIVNNTGTKSVYIGYNNLVSQTINSVIIPSGGYWELVTPVYTGELWSITANATATLNITEFA